MKIDLSKTKSEDSGDVASLDFISYSAHDKIMLAGYIRSFSFLLKLISGVLREQSYVLLYPSLGEMNIINNVSLCEAVNRMEDNFGVQSILISEQFCIYTYLRDDLSVIKCGGLVDERISNLLDRIFLKHFKKGGVGFGENGKEYAKNLVKLLGVSDRFKGVI